MKVAIWTNSPTPQQCDFHEALRRHNIDLAVRYLEHLPPSRRALGWIEPEQLPAGESLLKSRVDPLGELTDWSERVHIIPGYSRREHRRLVVRLSRDSVPWAHWSECSRPVWRAYVTWTVKRWYAAHVNRSALGAFAQGVMAAHDFQRWGVRAEKIAQLYYSVDGSQPSMPVDKDTSEFVGGRTAFVFVGSLCHRKACDVLLKAFASLSSKHGGPVLVMVGDGPQAKQYRDLAARLRVSERVLFRGALPPTKIGSVLCRCHVLVLPSRFDGWGVALNEGASAGLALVASDRCGAAYHVLEPGLNGYRVRAGSARSLAAAMQIYVREPRVAAVHGAHSRVRFQQFTPDANAVRFISSIRGWLAGDSAWDRRNEEWNGSSTARVVARAA